MPKALKIAKNLVRFTKINIQELEEFTVPHLSAEQLKYRRTLKCVYVIEGVILTLTTYKDMEYLKY